MSKRPNAFMALFLDKKAREHLKNRSQHPAPQTVTFPSTPQKEDHPSPENIRNRLDEAQTEMEKKRSPERLKLIKNAMNIRREQVKLLDQLSDDQRQRLQSFAVKSFLNGGDS